MFPGPSMSNTISCEIATKMSRPDPRRNGRPAGRGPLRVLCGQVLPLLRPADRHADDLEGFRLRSAGSCCTIAPRCSARTARGIFWSIRRASTSVADHRCAIYATRPQICRDYSTHDASIGDDWVYDHYLETPEQVEEYAEAVLGPRRGRGFRSDAMTHATHHAPHAQGFPRLSAGGDDPARAAHRHRPAGLSLLRLHAHRHAGPGIPGDPGRQRGRGDRQAALQVPGPRRPLGRPAVRPDGAAGPLRRPARRRAGRAVQALSHRRGLAGREHAARPLPRVHAVRLRHHRHPLDRRRHRDGPGHPRPLPPDRLRAISPSA